MAAFIYVSVGTFDSNLTCGGFTDTTGSSSDDADFLRATSVSPEGVIYGIIVLLSILISKCIFVCRNTIWAIRCLFYGKIGIEGCALTRVSARLDDQITQMPLIIFLTMD